MALVLVSSQVSHTHLLTVVSNVLMFSCQEEKHVDHSKNFLFFYAVLTRN